MTSQDTLVARTTTTEASVCEHCGKVFNKGDSITMLENGKIKSCQHWHLEN